MVSDIEDKKFIFSDLALGIDKIIQIYYTTKEIIDPFPTLANSTVELYQGKCRGDQFEWNIYSNDHHGNGNIWINEKLNVINNL